MGLNHAASQSYRALYGDSFARKAVVTKPKAGSADGAGDQPPG